MLTAKLLAFALLIAATGPAPAEQGSGKTENAARGEVLEPFPFRLNRNGALTICLSMIFVAKPVSTFADHALYNSACARCHASGERLVRRIAGETPDEKRAWLDAFLVEHHPPDSESRADLLDFLLGK